ncbi:MAG: hypothetical protein NTY66_03635, partial [Candidatus Vogelbacteria bacterium]|nr:hypothetical protein [Candidatus Vogelbacteria bacterium]
MDEKIKTNDQCLARLRDNVETLKKLEGSKKWYEKGIDIGDSLGFFLLINFIVFTISGLNPIACLITSIILIWGMIWGMSKNDSKELSEAIKIYEQKVSAIAKEK